MDDRITAALVLESGNKIVASQQGKTRTSLNYSFGNKPELINPPRAYCDNRSRQSVGENPYSSGLINSSRELVKCVIEARMMT